MTHKEEIEKGIIDFIKIGSNSEKMKKEKCLYFKPGKKYNCVYYDFSF